VRAQFPVSEQNGLDDAVVDEGRVAAAVCGRPFGKDEVEEVEAAAVLEAEVEEAPEEELREVVAAGAAGGECERVRVLDEGVVAFFDAAGLGELADEGGAEAPGVVVAGEELLEHGFWHFDALFGSLFLKGIHFLIDGVIYL